MGTAWMSKTSYSIYKYMSGRYSSKEDAAAQLNAVRSKVPGAFVVKVEKDKVYVQ